MRTAAGRPAYRRCLAPLKPYVPGGTAEDVARHRPARISKMGSNENPLGPGRLAVEAVREAAARISVYPDPSAGLLRDALARGTGKSPGNFLVANGSDEVLVLIAATYLNPGDNAVVSEHTFFNYEFAARVFDGEVRAVPTRGLRCDLAAMRDAVDARTRIVFLCNPNNPTGLHVGAAELEAFLRSLPRETLAVVDEAYAEYADAPDFPDCAALTDRFHNLLVTRTFSKAHGLAGLRIGYAMAQEALIQDLRQVKLPFNVNAAAQAAALAALGDREHLARTLELNRLGKDLLTRALAAKGWEVLPSQGNFLCFRPTVVTALEVGEALFRQGVIVRPLGRFGLEDWIRVTVGTPAQNAHFLEALEGPAGA
jgi:histidinol-phosphate aminotransferase